LYEAGRAGVKINLIVRGICSLVTGLKGIGDHIRVISIVDRFLEHSRIFVFCNGGEELYFISSGDWMYRNLDHRSEVAVPIFDERLQKELRQYLHLQLNDNVKARLIDNDQSNVYVHAGGKYVLRSQSEIRKWVGKSKRLQ
jgi:polyphosphate kinase